jgi:hypothetical protein
MRFRPANISLINRRHYLPRLLLTLSLKYKNKNHPTDLQLLTGSHHITSEQDTMLRVSKSRTSLRDRTVGIVPVAN